MVNRGLIPHQRKQVLENMGNTESKRLDGNKPSLGDMQRRSFLVFSDQAAAVKVSWVLWWSHRAEVNHNLIQSHGAARDSGDKVKTSCCISVYLSFPKHSRPDSRRDWFSSSSSNVSWKSSIRTGWDEYFKWRRVTRPLASSAFFFKTPKPSQPITGSFWNIKETLWRETVFVDVNRVLRIYFRISESSALRRCRCRCRELSSVGFTTDSNTDVQILRNKATEPNLLRLHVH